MTIIQSRAPNRATFAFEEERFRYTISDASGSSTFPVDYEDWPLDYAETEERNAWFRHAGYLWIIIGVAQIAFRLYAGEGVGFPFWLLLGLACLGYYHYTAVKFRVYQTSRGRVYVIEDRQRDTVLGEISKRRRALLRQRYARLLDPQQAERESARFAWLLREEAISQDEYEDLMAELRLGVASLSSDEESS